MSSAVDILSLWVVRVRVQAGWWSCAYWTGGKRGGGKVAGWLVALATARWVFGPSRSGTSCGIARPRGCMPAAMRAATVNLERLADGVKPDACKVVVKGVSDPGELRDRPLRWAAAW